MGKKPTKPKNVCFNQGGASLAAAERRPHLGSDNRHCQRLFWVFCPGGRGMKGGPCLGSDLGKSRVCTFLSVQTCHACLSFPTCEGFLEWLTNQVLFPHFLSCHTSTHTHRDTHLCTCPVSTLRLPASTNCHHRESLGESLSLVLTPGVCHPAPHQASGLKT